MKRGKIRVFATAPTWRRLPSVSAPIGLAPSHAGGLSGANMPMVRASRGRRMPSGSRRSSISSGSPAVECAVTPATVPTFVRRDGEQIRDRTAAAKVPEIDEGFAFELAAEQSADPGAGEPERVAVGGVQFENEGIAQGRPYGARLDVGTLRRRALAAPFFPVSVKLPARCVFHGARSCIVAARLSLNGTAFASDGCLLECRAGGVPRRRAGAQRRR